MRTKLEIGLGIALVIVAGLFAFEWHQQVLAQAIAEAQKIATENALKGIDQKMQARDAEWKQQRDSLLEVIQKVKTPQQAVIAVPQVSNTPLPAQPFVIQAQPLPDAPKPQTGDVVIPAASASQMFQQFADDKVCRVDIAKCNADRQDLQQKFDLKSKESANWEKAARGGSVFKRTIDAACKIGLGVGIGFAIHH